MKKRFFIILNLSIATILLVGCGERLNKTYTSKETGDIQLKPDGTAHMKQYNLHGTYVKDGDQVAVKTANATFFYTIKDGQLQEGILKPSSKIFPAVQPASPNAPTPQGVALQSPTGPLQPYTGTPQPNPPHSMLPPSPPVTDPYATPPTPEPTKKPVPPRKN